MLECDKVTYEEELNYDRRNSLRQPRWAAEFVRAAIDEVRRAIPALQALQHVI